MSKKSSPAPPQFVAPPPAPSPIIAPNAQATVPNAQKPTKLFQKGLEAEALLPDFLQLNENPLDPAVLKEFQDNFFAQNINPQLAEAEAEIGGGGQAFSSFGGGLIGGLRSQGQLDKFSAGLAATQSANDLRLQNRASLFNGGIGLAERQNQLGVQRGLGVAGIQSADTANLNNFQGNIFGNQIASNSAQNNFNSTNFANQLAAKAQADRQRQNTAFGIGGGLLNGLRFGAGLIGGGGGGSAAGFPTLGASTGSVFGATPTLAQGIGLQ